MKKICIVTTRHISYNPRVLKEADLLFKNGYEVCVVTVNNNLQQSRFDEEIMKDRKWRLKTVDFRKELKDEKRRWLRLSIRQKLFSKLSGASYKNGIAERAINKAFDELLALAIVEKADLYITHHPEALPIGFLAAKKNSSKFGFDAEDFHTGMNEGAGESKEEALIVYLEKKYLPYCAYITAASKGIAEAYVKKYTIPQPEVILNVFPLKPLSVGEVNSPVKFYWYSQVIGANRNLELLLQAAGSLKGNFELHLRGSFQSSAYHQTLLTLVEQYKLKGSVFFHPPIVAEQIIGDANQYDVGLALESDVSVNRNICVTNKIFTYLMAGLAIVGTDTYGQKDIFSHFPHAVQVCKMTQEDLARCMLFFIEHKSQLFQAKQLARQAAETTFNWEHSSNQFLQTVKKTLKGENKSSIMVPEITT